MIYLLKYLFDTNVCIRYITGRSIPLRDKIIATPANEIAVCSIVKAEMFYGSMKSGKFNRPPIIYSGRKDTILIQTSPLPGAEPYFPNYSKNFRSFPNLHLPARSLPDKPLLPNTEQKA